MCTLEFNIRAIEDSQKGDKKDTFDAVIDGVFIRAIEDATEGSSDGTTKGVV